MTEIAVILAGGSGLRLWPLSRRYRPKQYIDISSGLSLLRESFLQVQTILPKEQIFVVAPENQLPIILEILPEINEDQVILEPDQKDSGMALALAAIYLDRFYPGATLLVYPLGIILEEIEKIIESIYHGIHFARELSCSILLGVEDDNPGVYDCYLEIGDVISKDEELSVYDIKRILPHYPVEAIEIEDYHILRHTGIVIVECQNYLEELSEHTPEIYSSLLELQEQIGKGKEDVVKERLYQHAANYNLERDILSKSKRLLALNARSELNNIQGWSSISRLLEKDESNNTFTGLVESVESKNCMVLGNENDLIALVGVENLVVVRSKNAILVVNKLKDQKVKELLEKIKNKDSYEKFL